MAATDVPRRRWPRFSLRALLIAITLGAISLGTLANWIAAKHRENEAGRAVLNRGGSIAFFNGWDVRNRGWRVRLLSLVLPRDCLYTVQAVSFRKAGNEELALLSPLRDLEEVNLEGCQFNDVDLVYLKDLTELTFLELSETPLTDAGLAHIERHRRLKQLWLGHTRITDASLPLIVQNRGLTHLDLDSTAVTDRGCAHLAGSPQLEMLAIRSTGITSDVTATLKQLPKLKYLYVMRTAIDDKAVPDLAQLKLQQLDVRQTKITAAGYEKLKQAMPNCKIEWLPPR